MDVPKQKEWAKRLADAGSEGLDRKLFEHGGPECTGFRSLPSASRPPASVPTVSGGTVSEPLRESKVFPDMVSHMIGVGEETGALDSMLSKVADFYEDEVAAAVKALTSIMEPAMIILVGGIVGVIVISMYLPLFNVYNSIR